ncbi:MAG: hypothetical protein J0L77_07395 [Alphaproteobacteria bacterium]|nr:hypothetical protein [Alphaproteobacteria bacterium]
MKISSKAKGNFHESFVEFDHPEGPTNRNFGYTVGGILLVLGILKAIFHYSFFVPILLIVGAGLVTAAALKPESLTKANAGWMKFAEILFHIINPVVMFLMFVICFVPAGLIMKLIKFDPMRRRFDPSAKTYWVEKPKTDLPDPMKYQF